jgi:hypothetical protein
VPWEWLPSLKLPLKRVKRRLSSLSALCVARGTSIKRAAPHSKLNQKRFKNSFPLPQRERVFKGCISTFTSGTPFDVEKLSQFPFKNGHSRRNFLPASRPIITSKEVLNMYFPPAAVHKFQHTKNIIKSGERERGASFFE